jgi:hypothetical protein
MLHIFQQDCSPFSYAYTVLKVWNSSCSYYVWKFLNTALKSMALEIPHTSISQLTNSSLLLSSRNKINRTKTVASTCFLVCLTLMMKALCYFKTQVSLYHRHSQHPKIPESSAYVLLLCVPIFSPVIFIFA